MKKFIALLLVALMGLGCLSACTKPEEPVEPKSYLNEAKSYIRAMYKDVPAKTTANFSRIAQVTISGKTFPITWTVNNDAIKVSEPADNKVTFTLPEAGEEQIDYTVTATVTEGEATLSTSFDYYIPAVEKKEGGFVIASAPVAGQSYKIGFYQANIEKQLYFNGGLSGNYLACTENPAEAVDVTVEEVEGGYRLSFIDAEGTKQYMDIYEYTEGKAGVRITTEPTATFIWNADAKTFIAPDIAGEDRYMGTYNSYNTISSSATSYILGDNLSKVDVSQFPCHIGSVESAGPTVVADPATETAYKIGFYQANIEKQLYFNGTLSGNYLACSENVAEAVDVFVEAAGDAFHIYFIDAEGTKQYMDIYEYTEGKAGVRITTEPTAAFVWNADAKTFVAPDIAGADRYMGTYNTYNTISSSATSYILGDNLSKVDVSQFPCHLYVFD